MYASINFTEQNNPASLINALEARGITNLCLTDEWFEKKYYYILYKLFSGCTAEEAVCLAFGEMI